MIRLLRALCAISVASIATASASTENERIIAALHAYDRAIVEHDRERAATLLHPEFIYSESPSHGSLEAEPLPARIAHRFERAACVAETTAARIVGSTAIVTGAHRRVNSSNTPDGFTRGRFTTTWVKSDGEWRLLAEHRSWTAEPQPQPAAPVFAASKSTAPVAPTASRPASAPAVAATPAHASQESPAAADVDELRLHGGLLPRSFTRRFRAYEPNVIGYTWDRGDDGFMDFTFSTMFDVLSRETAYPPARRGDAHAAFDRKLTYSTPRLYFAGTIRAGQYIETRPSSPVVGKRFNPLFALRFWGLGANGAKESEDNFFEFVLGHESNGQFIASKERFDEQLAVYQNQARDARSLDDAVLARNSAYRSTRDNLSRGWDYVGFQFARDWDSHVWWGGFRRPATMGLRAKLNYYLRNGPAQGKAEEFKPWENQLDGKSRKHVDGLSFRYSMIVARRPVGAAQPWWSKIFRFDRRYAVTLTTGYQDPFRFITLKSEADVTLFNWLPMTVWYRHGYNSDLVDYYRKDHSLGLSLSFWSF